MITDRNLSTEIIENIYRHANGSIDYGYYDQRAREIRGFAFRDAGRSVWAPVRRLIGLLAGGRAARQSEVEPIQARPLRPQPEPRCDTATPAPKPYSEAA